MLSVVLVDRWRTFAEALSLALEREAGVAVVGIAFDVEPAAHQIREHHPQVVVVTRELAADLFVALGENEETDARIIVLADASDEPHAAELVRAGCAGWVPRQANVGVLADAIRAVMRKETVIPAALLTRVLSEIAWAPAAASRRERVLAMLTPREAQILAMMETGVERRDIARRLRLSPHTVRTHIQRILPRLGVHSAIEAVSLLRGEKPRDVLPPIAATEGLGIGNPTGRRRGGPCQ
jgi:DNA-binding NarL/FixJ family response regulator